MEKSFKQRLLELRDSCGFAIHTQCDETETNEFKERKAKNEPLPDDVVSCMDENYTTKYERISNDTSISYEERMEYLALQQTVHLKKIQGYVLFFVVLTCISIIAGVIAALSIAS